MNRLWKSFMNTNLSYVATNDGVFWAKVWLRLGADIHYFNDICFKESTSER